MSVFDDDDRHLYRAINPTYEDEVNRCEADHADGSVCLTPLNRDGSCPAAVNHAGIRASHPGYGIADNGIGLEMWTTTSNQVWVAAFWGEYRTFAVVPAEEVLVG